MATSTGVLSKRGYARLLKDSETILERGREQAEAAVGKVLVRTYWALGQRILREGLSERAGYGAGVVEDLAADLQLSRALMFRVVAFARAHPRRAPEGLTWSQYGALLAVKSEQARAFYEQRALSEGWTQRQLQDAIRRGAFALEAEAGGRAGAGAKIARPTTTTHVYAVEVTRVIDGDTLVVEIDLGFDVLRRQKMRLADIDAPEMASAEGKEAARYLRERLAAAEAVAVKTIKREDVHGRYVGHLFYSTTPATTDETFRKGKHLNAELAAKGHARVV